MGTGTEQNRNKKLINDIGIYAIGNLGSKLITFLMVPLYTYFISDVSDFGYYDLCLSVVFFFVPFVTLQLGDGAFRFLLNVGDDKARQREVLSVTYRTLASMLSMASTRRAPQGIRRSMFWAETNSVTQWIRASGLMSAARSARISAFMRPIVLVSAGSWRLTLLRATASPSISVSVPMPVRASASAHQLPTPPRPTMQT